MILGVVPAAGHATRLSGVAGSKEMLRVGGRPVIDYLLERMRAAAGDVVVVPRPEKADVLAHARALGLRLVEGRPANVSESLRLGLDGAEAVLLGFPDTIWEPEDGFGRLLDGLGEADVVLGLFRSQEPERSDVVELDGDRVVSVEIKPARPRSDLIWGCAAARGSALEGLARHDEPGRLFAELAGDGRVRAVPFPGQMIDIGTDEALERARRLFGE
ncbi:MAG TPA: NTP transferase domain-containing protein [Gaiellaceae bacterium]|nr:NTP transferase domain-containing protein [Gaiellaceae bacterium]